MIAAITALLAAMSIHGLIAEAQLQLGDGLRLEGKLALTLSGGTTFLTVSQTP